MLANIRGEEPHEAYFREIEEPPHAAGLNCWCSPSLVKGRIVHRSLAREIEAARDLSNLLLRIDRAVALLDGDYFGVNMFRAISVIRSLMGRAESQFSESDQNSRTLKI